MRWRRDSFRLGDFSATGRKTLRSRTWQEHCMPTGLGVRYRSSGRSKWKSRIECSESLRSMHLKDRLLRHIFQRYYRWRLVEIAAPEYPIMLEYPLNPTH